MPLPLAMAGGYAVRKGLKHLKGRSLTALRHKKKASAGTRPKRRSRSVFMRKGRLFIGFTSKEVKNALRSRYGGQRRKR